MSTYSNITLSFVLNADNLFDGAESKTVESVDVPASAARYCEQIASRVKNKFPGIAVDYTINHNVTGYAGSPVVNGAGDDEDIIIDNYNEIDSELFNQYDDWAVQKAA